VVIAAHNACIRELLQEVNVHKKSMCGGGGAEGQEMGLLPVPCPPVSCPSAPPLPHRTPPNPLSLPAKQTSGFPAEPECQ
jgi:hypothetical protein